MNEIWKDVRDFEGIYQVSNLGRLKALEREVLVCGGATRRIPEHIIKPMKCKNGYYEASFSLKQRRTVRLLHRVVADAFIPNPFNLPEVNHKDENIANCRADNLEWCTSKYNANYGTRNARMMVLRKTKRVAQRTKDGEFINCFKSIADAERVTGVDNTTITRACKGKQKTAGGFVWQYVE